MNTNETAKWLSCPLPALVLCTAVTPRRTKPSITFPRTQYGVLPLGSQQPEPQKRRRRLPPTNTSALLFAGRSRRTAWLDPPFCATSHQLRETNPMQKTLLIGYLGKDP